MARKKDTGLPKQEFGAALRQCEDRLKCILDLSTEWYWEQDENHRFTVITGAGFGTLGSDLQAYVGTARWEHDVGPVGDDGSWDKHKAVLAARQPFADFVTRRVDPQGEMHYYSVSGRPVFDGTRFVGYRGIAKDITVSKRAEQLLRLEHMVARCVADADSASAALKTVLRSICETQSWECGRYFRRDNDGVFSFSEYWNIPNPQIDRFIAWSRERSYAPGVGLVGRVGESGAPMWVANVANDPRVAHKVLADEHGMRGAFLFPVMSEGRPIGVMVFNSREVREPDARLLEAVGVISSQIGQFLQRKQAEERVQYLATHDGLTGLPNRVMFSQLLNFAIPHVQRRKQSLAVLFIDLDSFKAINDTRGHDAGDRVLQEIATRFTGCLRASDVVARLGGDEFVVLLQEIDQTEQVAEVVRKILAAAFEPVIVLGRECHVTASIGICMCPADAQDAQTLLKNADAAMYLAKKKGKNNFQFCSGNIQG